MNLDLKNKRALVCGSTQGIGKACAMELASMGCNVTLVARNEDELKKVKAELPANNNQIHSYLCVDFSNPTNLKELTEAFIQRTGPVHVLVNNTGGPPAGPINQAKTEEFLSAFNQH
ncbi:MAG: SDR family NAD(P)-dependent oxidoreductase, partial [Bacteroidia bacterium]|nr:SDR family NAD(P)-dependent oxidoreductase [Bacteroidia bacterium]